MKILLIAEPGSSHTAGFHNVLKELGQDVRIFAINQYFRVYSELKDPVIYADSNNHETENFNAEFVFRKRRSLLNRQFVRLQSHFFRKNSRLEREWIFRRREKHLIQVINIWAPELLITLKLQNEGYFYSYVLTGNPEVNNLPWVHFLWGTDLEFFAHNSRVRIEHSPLIQKAMRKCKYVLTDTLRDVSEVRKFGFKGEVLGTLVAFGGIESNMIIDRAKDVSKRDKIIIKGREGGLVGRAGLVIRSVAALPDARLDNFEFHLIMPTEEALNIVNECKLLSNKKFVIHNHLSHGGVIDLMSRSAIAISASDIDGTPGFLIESMAYGAIPIHSSMVSIREWIEDGVNGFLFENNILSLQQSIVHALDASKDWNTIAEKNAEIVRLRASRAFVAQKLSEILSRFDQNSTKPYTPPQA